MVHTTGIIFILLALYCALDPFNHSTISRLPADFVAYKVQAPDLSLVATDIDKENLLQKSEIRFLNQIQGPESISFDALGRGPYTGVADGRVIFWDGTNWTDFAYTSSNRSDQCKPKPSISDYSENEHICGRPLGVRFRKETGEMYIADAYFGIMKVQPEGGVATSLTTEAEGVPFKFTNDLDIDDQGNVYFTDSSTKYQRREYKQLIISGESSGRVLKYDANTNKTSVLERDLQFPNGVTLSADGSFFVFCEGAMGRLRKYWLKGEKAGTSEILVILPGYPDNIRTNKDGDFWVAMNYRRSICMHLMSLYPRLRTLVLKLPIPPRIMSLVEMDGWQHAIIAKYSPEGKLLQILEDSEGKVVTADSEVEEKDGKLWIGSVLNSYIAVYHLA